MPEDVPVMKMQGFRLVVTASVNAYNVRIPPIRGLMESTD